MRVLGLLVAVCVTAGAASAPVTLLEELVRLEAAESRNYEFSLPQQRAELEIGWQVREGGAAVRMLVLSRGSEAVLLDSGYQGEGTWRVKLPRAGEYVFRIENERQRKGFQLVELRLSLMFLKGGTSVQPIEATPSRRIGSIMLSLGLFAASVAFAWRRLGPALRARLRQ